jgi:hypothetical protein
MTLYAELDGQFVSVDKQDTVTIDSDGTFTDVLPINGGSSAGVFTSNSANANAGDIATSDISIDYSRITGALGLGGASNGPVQLAYGVLASKSNLELVSSVSLDSQPGTADLDETVDGWSAGPMLALSTSKPLSDKLTGTLKGRLALLYASANLDAKQTASNHLGGGLEVTDDANALAGLAEVDLGLSLAASDKLSFSLSVGGGVRNDYFSIVNPRSAAGEDANNAGGDGTAYNPGPASLEQAVMWNANVKAGITGKF